MRCQIQNVDIKKSKRIWGGRGGEKRVRVFCLSNWTDSC